MKIGHAIGAVVVLTLAACASRAPVPVVDRAAPPPAPAPLVKPAVPVPVTGEGRLPYTVKKGDTLYSIALEHGHDYRDVAAWNGIENPNRIQVGQELRMSPPESVAVPESEAPVAVITPVVNTALVETRPVASDGDGVKHGPKGGKLPYSERALASLREAPPSESLTQKPIEKPAEKVAEKTVEKPLQKVEEKPAPVAPLPEADAVNWAWPAPGKTLAGFSEGGGGAESNKGVDILGKTGDPVLAAAEGKVVYVGSGLRGYGNLVIVRHNATYLSAYAHNSKILVKETQAVSRGQKIAEIGNSDADQAKLHFEIRRQGKPVDPLKYLPVR